MENLQKILSEIIADFIPDFKSIEDISRLSGGSSNESWKITLNTKENKKKIFKESILVGIVSYAVLIFRSNFVTFESTKSATVFTNEPQF